VIARYLINRGAEVNIFLLSPREKIKRDAQINLNILEKMRANIWDLNSEESIELFEDVWAESDLIIDAILGTGLKSEVRPPYSEAIVKINNLSSFKLSLDIPSGIDSDTGEIRGIAVEADLTVTYGFQKLGMAMYPGRSLCGKIEVVDISIPRISVDHNPPAARLISMPDITKYVGIRSNPIAHKGTFGRVLIIGGSPGKTGAPAMAAQAASRVGAGLVTVAVPASLNSILEIKLTEEMTEPMPDDLGFFDSSVIQRIPELCRDKTCVALGPGLSTAPGSVKLTQALLSEYEGRLVIDADGLNCLALDLSFLSRTKAKVVLTPHPGEMARLTGLSTAEVQRNRFALAKEFASTHKCWLVLKGAATITFSPYGQSFINSTGNPWMASGGQGDVLTGVLAGLLAQELPSEDVIPLGVWLHGFVADSIVDRDGPRPVLATDILKEIPASLKVLTETLA
jgi:ADP-dependent NAD(P)H-hydrate dehydratase / NAD(P)H-hydrate epimerase